jgi:oligo-1,6-glucosidase
VIALGDFTMLLADDPCVYAFTRAWDNMEMLVVANLSSAPAAAPVPEEASWAAAEVVLASGGPAVVPRTAPIVLAPWEARVYRRTRSST